MQKGDGLVPGVADQQGGPERSHRIYVVTAAVIRRGDEVLLVEQAPDSGEVGWSLPGGVVEPDEEVTVALTREVAEETGLRVVENHSLAYAVQNMRATDLTLAFVFEVSADGQVVAADPDHEIRSARFLPAREAIERLRWAKNQGP